MNARELMQDLDEFGEEEGLFVEQTCSIDDLNKDVLRPVAQVVKYRGRVRIIMGTERIDGEKEPREGVQEPLSGQ